LPWMEPLHARIEVMDTARRVLRNRNSAKANAARHAANVLPIIEKIRADGITTLAAIAAELNERKVRTAAGGSWHAMTVARVLKAGV
jgi:hypothetical protein